MPDIKSKFKELEIKYPYWSSYTLFAEVCQDIILTETEIRKGFRKLVSKEDYFRGDLRRIWNHLYKISKKRGEKTSNLSDAEK